MKKSKLLDLFCGCGGLSLGFENAGFEIVKAIDFNKAAIETYNFNRKKSHGFVCDLTKIDSSFYEGLEDVSGIIGGPPCQGFSTAGKRGKDDLRNKLYKVYFEILKNVNPNFFVIENVTGILNYAKGAIKDDIFEHADALGYKIYHEILNAADYGVPQLRKRVIFVGIKKEFVSKLGEFTFPKPTNLDSHLTVLEALSDLPLTTSCNPNETFDYISEPKNSYQKLMRKKSFSVHNHNSTNHSLDTIKTIKLVPEGGSIKDLTLEEKGNRKYNALLRKMNRNKPALTIDTGHRTYFHYSEPRIPSIRESARLQSFPDDFIFIGSKVEQYKQVGNAVPPLLAFKIASRIEEYFNGGYKNE